MKKEEASNKIKSKSKGIIVYIKLYSTEPSMAVIEDQRQVHMDFPAIGFIMI
jgi:hypothetical protein